MTETEIIAILKERLSEKRVSHSINTSKEAQALAIRWGADIEKCKLAGLIHDCGKLKNKDEIIPECEKYEIELTEEDLKCPQIIHSYLSEAIAREEYKIEDREVLAAIRNHTLGRENMSLVEKIIFTADMIEPGREDIFQSIKKLAYEDLDKAVLEIYKQTIDYNVKKGNHVHKTALQNKIKLEEELYGT